jgi:cation transporter-like permease
MKRFQSILKETWWVWLTLVVGGTIAGIVVSPIFLSAIPISAFSFIYFALVRYDEDGNPRVTE